MCSECGDGFVRANAFGRFVLAQSDQFDLVDNLGNLVVLRKWLILEEESFALRRQFSNIVDIRLGKIQGVFEDPIVSKGGSQGEETPCRP